MYLFVPLGALEDVGMEYVQMYVRHLCLVFFLLGIVGGQVLPEVSQIKFRVNSAVALLGSSIQRN